MPGGPGFNYYGRDWLGHLDPDYGIRGEAEFSFPLYLKRLEGGNISSVPGCVFRKDGHMSKPNSLTGIGSLIHTCQGSQTQTFLVERVSTNAAVCGKIGAAPSAEA